MGFGHLPQWQRHLVTDGHCLCCNTALPGDGIICTVEGVNAPGMVFLGDLPHAKPCQQAERQAPLERQSQEGVH